ncbi:GNAT family N-acetyltransferase [Roseovarius faecimaris]|uniref:GNAT family N-acetyltransferase n=1 Tax=Roseovarius faecimaris TaxID=2494550 RepID=A0A6I6ISX0_9RHOB|nr:GNAT family N-acetyltransferase [Roseovarius faecimaris]QGY00170.1 GNAT family N-acetyltransferase [Roseovarius faecimaris]
MIHIRPAGALDAPAMAELLNAIIARGGTTAHTTPVTRTDIIAFMSKDPERAAWLVAEDDAGTLLGFQLIEPMDTLPPEACDIGTFTRLGRTQSGIGSALFERTRLEAIKLGYSWINATIRADNAGGLAYYQSRGFEPYATHRNIRLDDGTLVDKISKRYNL